MRKKSNKSKNHNFEKVLAGVFLANLVLIGFPWLANLALVKMAEDGASGTEFLGIFLIPIYILGAIIAAFSTLALLVVPFFVRPHNVGYGILGVILALACGAYASYIIGMTLDYANSERALYAREKKVLSKDEALQYFNECRVTLVTTDDLMGDNYSKADRHGIGGLEVKNNDTTSSYDERRSIEDTDILAYVKAGYDNYEKCGEVKIDLGDNSFSAHDRAPRASDEDDDFIDGQQVLSSLDKCEFIAMLWIQDKDWDFGTGRIQGGELYGVAYWAYKSKPIVLYISDGTSPLFREAAKKAQASCPQMRVIENASRGASFY